MELYWAGKNITKYVTISGCIHRDASCGRCDSLDLTLDHASTWYRWGPEEDDEIRVTHEKDDTGVLYLNAVIPEDDRYRLIATGVRRAAARKAWGSWRNTTLQNVFEQMAAECQMDGKLYGMDGSLPYSFLIRENEGPAALLNRIGAWEGMAVKTYDGAFRGIGIAYAQTRKAEMVIRIDGEKDGVRYKRRDSQKYISLTVKTPWAEVTARDTAAKGGNTLTLTHLPAMNSEQAGRWARGLLMMHNRKTESVTLDITLNTRLTAMTRVDITGGTDMTGQWIVEEAEHDLFNRTTTAKLLRVVDSIL